MNIENKKDTPQENRIIKDRRFICGCLVGIFTALLFVGILWLVISNNWGRSLQRINRSNPEKTASAFASAFLDKDYERFIEFLPPNEPISREDWETGSFVCCNSLFASEPVPTLRDQWIEGSFTGYKIVDVLVSGTVLPDRKSASVIFNYQGQEYEVNGICLTRLSKLWYIEVGVYCTPAIDIIRK